QSAGGAVGDQDFVTGIVGQAVVAAELFGNSLPESRLSLIVRVTGPPATQRSLGRFDYRRRRRRIRLPAHERYQRSPLGLKLAHLLQNLIAGGRPQSRHTRR